MGTVWGVAAVSTITQSVLNARLPEAFSGIPGGQEVTFYCPCRHFVIEVAKLTRDFLCSGRRLSCWIFLPVGCDWGSFGS